MILSAETARRIRASNAENRVWPPALQDNFVMIRPANAKAALEIRKYAEISASRTPAAALTATAMTVSFVMVRRLAIPRQVFARQGLRLRATTTWLVRRTAAMQALTNASIHRTTANVRQDRPAIPPAVVRIHASRVEAFAALRQGLMEMLTGVMMPRAFIGVVAALLIRIVAIVVPAAPELGPERVRVPAVDPEAALAAGQEPEEVVRQI